MPYWAESPAIGDFERYLAREVVGHVDGAFRTRAERSFRAVCGFSMGGHGALKVGMKSSGVFAQIGSLSGSPLSMRYRKPIYQKALVGQARPGSLKELVETVTFESNWTLAAVYAKAAAFSPNPGRPPLFLDLPFQATSSSEEREPIWKKWLDDDPLSLVARSREALSSMDQIYIDHGRRSSGSGPRTSCASWSATASA